MNKKYDYMKRDRHIWKFLKFGETGLGWDPTTRKFSGLNEQWDKKIKVSLLHILLQLIYNISKSL